jgi:hypothetical protein
MTSQLQSWVILEWLRARTPADKKHRIKVQYDGIAVYGGRTADSSDTMMLKVQADGWWSLHTSRCVVWCDGSHRAIGDQHIERDRLCSNAIEALSCYYTADELQGIP